jgi:hypothetical protein
MSALSKCDVRKGWKRTLAITDVEWVLTTTSALDASKREDMRDNNDAHRPVGIGRSLPRRGSDG